MIELLDTLVFSMIHGSVPFIFAGLGVLIAEKSGFLNLGQEGIVAFAAVVAFAGFASSESYLIAIILAVSSAILLNFIFAFLVLICGANQIVTGLALSILGLGLASYLGAAWIGESIEALSVLPIILLTDIPIFGSAFFSQDVVAYLAFASPVFVWGFLYKTKWGFVIRAVGESPDAAFSLGYRPQATRLFALTIGAVFVGLAGAYITLSIAPVLSDGVSAGRGWIALALVVFASHKIGRLVFGALLFGVMSVLPLGLQAFGLRFEPSLMAMMPYIATILGLVLIKLCATESTLHTPKSLGENFQETR